MCCLKHCSEHVFTSPGFVILVGAQRWFWKQPLWTHSIKLTLAWLSRFHRRALLPSVQLTAYLSLPDSAPARLMCLLAVPATSSSLGRAQFSVWQQRNFLGVLIKWILGTREAADKEKILLFTLFPNSDQPLILTWLLVHYLTWKTKMFYF